MFWAWSFEYNVEMVIGKIVTLGKPAADLSSAIGLTVYIIRGAETTIATIHIFHDSFQNFFQTAKYDKISESVAVFR